VGESPLYCTRLPVAALDGESRASFVIEGMVDVLVDGIKHFERAAAKHGRLRLRGMCI
jgi:hypothetical protein